MGEIQQKSDSLYIGNLNTVEFDLTLPQKTADGHGIVWKSDNTRFLKDDGKVEQPKYGMGSRDVLLHAYIGPEGKEVEKVFAVHVLEAANDIRVRRTYPVIATARVGEVFYLPSVAITDTEEGDTIAHPVEWKDGSEKQYDMPGRYEEKGFLSGTDIPATAEVMVSDDIERTPEKAEPSVFSFSLSDTEIMEGNMFRDEQDRFMEFLLKTDDDQMLYNFRLAAGLDTKGAPQMIGWDAPDSLLRGHTTGHYLSALALCYKVTGNPRIAKKAEYCIHELRICQKKFSESEGFHTGFLSGYSEKQFDLLEEYRHYPEIWAPYYTLHKILAGLIECSMAFQETEAFDIAKDLGLWVYERLHRLDHDRRVKMWGMYIAGEFGGMNEVMAQLYQMTGNEKYLVAAHYFDNDKLFYPMEHQIDTLGGMHANQHIPQMIGAMKIYEATGDERYYQMASWFWKTVTRAHIYAIGGTGEGEMFHKPECIAGKLSEHTAESCASYNMLKLTKELYQYDPQACYMDYYERTMINHILSSGEKKPTGASTYFMPLAPGFHKEFDEENSCCHGTGMENHFRYGECVWFQGENTIYVNLFLNSRLLWKAGKCILEQQTEEGKDSIVSRITIHGYCEFTLKIRVPYWKEGEIKTAVNGEEISAKEKDGYIEISRKFSDGDSVECRFGCGLRLEKTPDDAHLSSVSWGPYILAALTPQKEPIDITGAEGHIADFIEQIPGEKACFRIREKGISMMPLCMVEEETYQVYLKS